GDVERQLARRDEEFDLLPLAVFVDFKVVLRQARHELALGLDRNGQSDFESFEPGLIVLRCGLWPLWRGLVGRLLRERQRAHQQSDKQRTSYNCGCTSLHERGTSDIRV